MNLTDDYSSDRFLIDLQIEESLSRETLMSIDSSNRREDCITLTFCFLLLFFTSIVGFYGPPVQRSFKILYRFLQNENTASFPFHGLNQLNHFVQLKLSFLRINTTESISNTIILNSTVTLYQKNTVFSIEKFEKEEFPLYFEKGDNLSRPEIVFTDRLIKYDSTMVNVQFLSKTHQFIGCFAIWTFGDPEQPIIQMWFRGIYSIACLVSLFLFLMRLKKTPFKIWHLEQKLTAFLLLLAFFADDPFYFMQTLEVTKAGVFYDVISSALFRTYLQFFVLALFDSLRYKNRKIDSCFFAPKLLFFIFFALIEILHGFIDDSQTTLIMFMVPSIVRHIVSILQRILGIIYLIWMIIAIIRAGTFIDITEKYKFSVYSSVSIMSISVVMIVDLIILPYKLLQNTSLSFVLNFTAQNLFVLLMAIFHWPYETLMDQQYHDTSQGVTENDFFMNVDD
ncbi:hypothetical protein TRFO_14630 [Tritrichomonas foetus]|uniref:Wntless-like transmembrane domain-containing protein n=1 Tax=Tritrichomonas foetus TaxID=1144522 RepID=A0A1J4KUM0_9EUKA|nr:hypothetical protein TRFO_14630 [Tritrichomonas foetus]|eukprot:OHT14967.1 hypothetical protein TRFO_14630 [Tritrichomonas foetus]